MSSPAVRFLHASDLHLERPLGGVTEIPAGLGDLFLDAPYQAAEKLFATARNEAVDFIVLAGDVVDLEHGGARAIDFLRRQFLALQQDRIDVYWVGGRVDDLDLWPAQLPLPENVHRFPADRVDERTVTRKNQPVAIVAGQGYQPHQPFVPRAFASSPADLPRVAAAYGACKAAELAEQGVDYWALGGRHRQITLHDDSTSACYSGTPQGRGPAEEGPCGALLVEMNSEGVTTRSIETAVVQWHRERLELPPQADREQLEALLNERTRSLARSHTAGPLLVSWMIAADGPLAVQLRHGTLADELLHSLHQEQESSPESRVWAVELTSEPASLPEDLYHEDTILGDFLRTIRRYEKSSEQLFDLEPLLPDVPEKQQLAAALRMSSPAERRRILAQVAALGVDLLRGDAAC